MKWAGFDVETWGTRPEYALQPWRAKTGAAWLTSVVGQSEHDTLDAIKPEHPDPGTMKELIRRFLVGCAQRGEYIATWNGPFDMAFLIASGLRAEVVACKWIDGLLLYRHFKQYPTFENYDPDIAKTSFGLKAAVREFIPACAGYEDDVTYDPQTPEEWAKLREYNARDVRFTIEICKRLWNTELTKAQQRVALIEAQCLPMMAESTTRGLLVDMGAADQLGAELRNTAAEKFVALKVGSPEVTAKILASPKALSELLKTWGLPVVAVTAKGAPSTDKDTLDQLAQLDPRAKLVADYREAMNNRAKFAEAPMESVAYNGSGWTHPSPKVYGTYTGRLTYSSTQGTGKGRRQTGIALHQWKRTAEFRRLIRAPEGYTLCEFDFAGQEFRWMGVMSKDPTMLELCRPGEDAHGFMGASIRGIDYRTLVARVKAGDKDAAEIRRLGKVANLSLQYGTSASRLRTLARVQYSLILSDAEASVIHKTYRRTYQRVPLYWKEQRVLARSGNAISNLLGRQVHFLPRAARANEYAWSYDATAINFPIQSIGAEQKYLALMVMRSQLPTWRAHFYFELHDGLFFIVPDELAEKFVARCKKLLSNLPYERAWKLKLPIDFPVDAKMGPTWGDLKEYHG